MLAASTAILFGWSAADRTPGRLAGAAVRSGIVDLGVAIGVGGVVTGVAFLVLRRRWALPWPYVWTLLTSLVVLMTLGAGASRRGWYLTVAVVVGGASLLGAGMATLLVGRRRRSTGAGLTLLTAGAVVLGVPATSLALAGGPPPDETATAPTPAVRVADLSRAGPHDVSIATYGSGDDARPRYGEQVEVTTEPVDGAALLEGWDERRTTHWGFDPERLPINARVWYPETPGTFPLVLIAHGNDSAREASELGFGYLAEHLASHGFVTVAVDQNFLDTSLLDQAGGPRDLETARAWLLLQHLDQWRAWADAPDHPLGAKVDTATIGLVGHSRGGAAIAVASRLDELGRLPERPELEVPHGFAIDALLALAPAPAEDPATDGDLVLEDVSYLTIQGSHDADIVDFVGLDQLERVSIGRGSGRLTGALYVEAANHTQFNDRWGRHDLGHGLPKHYLDTRALLDGDDQRRITTGYANAFLSTALGGEDHRALLADHATGASWLPRTGFVSRYRDAETSVAVDVDEVDDAGASFQHEGFASVETIRRPARTGASTDLMAELTWDEHEDGVPATVTFDLQRSDADGPTPTTAPTHVVFDAVADTTLDADAVTVTVTDDDGRTASSSLEDLGVALQGLVDGRYLKAAWLHDSRSVEAVPGTHRLPLEAFLEREEELDLAGLASVTIQIETSRPGVLLLDDVGVARHP